MHCSIRSCRSPYEILKVDEESRKVLVEHLVAVLLMRFLTFVHQIEIVSCESCRSPYEILMGEELDSFWGRNGLPFSL